ncbi:MAG: DUF1998 domain-containing protein [Pseudomonadota bacterium]
MRQLTIECGYTAASIRERIYAREPDEEGGAMSGLLIYTAAADSEGTLGGLIYQAQPSILARHLEQILEEQLTLCSSDPLCAEHHPIGENISLHGAACHTCLFSPETSCERSNKYLDRALFMPVLLRVFPQGLDGIAPKKRLSLAFGESPIYQYIFQNMMNTCNRIL